MEQQALQLYSTLFNPEVAKDFEFFKVFYSTLVHANGLRSILDANLAAKDPIVDKFVIILLNYGINFYKDAIEYPNSGSAPAAAEPVMEEDDITNLKPSESAPSDSTSNPDPSDSRTQNFDLVVFKNLDEELRLQLILNIVKIIRIIINSVVSTGRLRDFLLKPDRKGSVADENEADQDITNSENEEKPIVNPETVEYEWFFRMNEWFLSKLVPGIELPGMNQTSLIIIKELIFLVYDYLMAIKADGGATLQSFNSQFPSYLELFVELLYLTHPKFGDEIVPPTIRLSLESLIRIFYIVSLLNSGSGFNYDVTVPKYYLINSQISDILKYSLKYCHTYSTDMFNSQNMSESFFNWCTGNMLNFSNKYINNKYIANSLVPENKELSEIFSNRSKEFYQLELENFNVPEFLPINLYLYNLLTHLEFMEFLLDDSDDNDLMNVWTCLVSYFLMYQYKSKQLLLNTRLILLIMAKVIKHESIGQRTINEFQWKLCRQRTPIIPLNKEENETKPLLSYFLDNLLVLIRYNINRKLNVENFMNAIKLINLIIHTLVDENYHYDELIKSCIKLLTFNHKHIKHPGLTHEILVLLNNGLTTNSSIKFDVLYNLLLEFEVVDTIPLTDPQLGNLFKGIEYCKEKFDLLGEGGDKISLLDSDVDSPELVDALNAFEPKVEEKGVSLPVVNINVSELLVNI